MAKYDKILWRYISDAVLHWPSILFVVIFSACTSIESTYGFLTFSENKLIDLVFPISGTIVALALPAAQLSSDLVTQVEESSLKFLKNPVDQDKKSEFVSETVNEYRENLSPAWRAVVYALLSFLLSVVGSLGPFPGTLVSRLVATAALSCLIMSAIWFYPTVRFAFGLEFLKTLERIAEALNRPKIEGEEEETAAPPSPVA
jgi:hypothetical protein